MTCVVSFLVKEVCKIVELVPWVEDLKLLAKLDMHVVADEYRAPGLEGLRFSRRFRKMGGINGGIEKGLRDCV